jgi:hypothetical protein
MDAIDGYIFSVEVEDTEDMSGFNVKLADEVAALIAAHAEI